MGSNPTPSALFAHVFVAVVAIGANLTYVLWLRIGERDPEHLAYSAFTLVVWGSSPRPWCS